MDYNDGKSLLNILKPKKGDAPLFGEIQFDQIIFDRLKSSPAVTASPEPKVLVLCGPPGCGKSTVKTRLLSQITVTNYINIDPDEIRTILMSLGVTFPDDKTMAGITNAFNKRMSDEAQKQHLNIVFDTTGQNFRAVSDLIYTSRQRGYKSYFSIIWSSLETCKRRIEGRNKYLRDTHSGRIELPIDVAEGIYNGFVQPKGTASMFLIDYPVRADEVFLYNNNEDGVEPQLLYHKVGNNVITSTDFTGFYNMNLKVDGTITKESKGGKTRKIRNQFKKKYNNIYILMRHTKKPRKNSKKGTRKRLFQRGGTVSELINQSLKNFVTEYIGKSSEKEKEKTINKYTEIVVAQCEQKSHNPPASGWLRWPFGTSTSVNQTPPQYMPENKPITTNFSQQSQNLSKEQIEINKYKQEVIDAFKGFDKGNTGFISAAELRNILTNLGEKISEDEVDEMINEADVDRNGQIDYVKFVNKME